MSNDLSNPAAQTQVSNIFSENVEVSSLRLRDLPSMAIKLFDRRILHFR
jgi:hypothetical protein